MLVKEELEKYSGTKHKDIDRINCITGKSNHLYIQLKDAMERAVSIDIIVSFIMESGVKLIIDDLKRGMEQGKKIRILTGNYLNITQPTALYMLRDVLGDNVDIRFYADKSRSFHPKAYIFHYEDGSGDIFIGSSNMSRMALTRGLEWNYRLSKENNKSDFQMFLDRFEELFLNESIIVDDTELKRYSKSWIKPKIQNGLHEIENDDKNENEKVVDIFSPRGAQIEALYELKRKREEDWDKALVVAATGVGKTYLAAFDSKNYKRILFVAHKIEILEQARDTFKTIRPDIDLGFFMNSMKDTNSDLVFAGVQTLGKKIYLNNEYFSQDYFDYIIIDETHHIVAKNYRNIIDYFKPKFLLGLTATPDRLDNKDVYSLFDYNIAYEVYLHEAINKGWLVPFRYYGIYDESVDYQTIEYKNGKYDDKDLGKALMKSDRAVLILKHYRKFKSNKALGFCSNKAHAEFMAEFFNKNGVKSCAVYSGDLGGNALDRKEAIEKLKNGEINIIFSVDMFNEGVDIKSVNMVLFLRPTQSPTVFLQQLGRGLRKDGNKKYLNVLDFIGNYKKVDLIPMLLKGKKEIEKSGNLIPDESELPEGCLIDFDIRSLDVMEKFRRNTSKIEELIDSEFKRIKNDLDRNPSRYEMFTQMDSEVYKKMKAKKKTNILKGYLKYLDMSNNIDDMSKKLIGTEAELFLKTLEETSMSKSYKMPILLAFYNNGDIKMRINEDDIYESFKMYYSKGTNGCDLKKHKQTKDYKSWGKSKYVSLAKRNPVKFLEKSGDGFFFIDGNEFCLKEELREFIYNDIFRKHFKDIIEYRSAEYFKTRYENEYEQ